MDFDKRERGDALPAAVAGRGPARDREPHAPAAGQQAHCTGQKIKLFRVAAGAERAHMQGGVGRRQMAAIRMLVNDRQKRHVDRQRGMRAERRQHQPPAGIGVDDQPVESGGLREEAKALPDFGYVLERPPDPGLLGVAIACWQVISIGAEVGTEQHL